MRFFVVENLWLTKENKNREGNVRLFLGNMEVYIFGQRSRKMGRINASFTKSVTAAKSSREMF